MAKTSIEKFFGNKYVQLGALIAGALALYRTWKKDAISGIGNNTDLYRMYNPASNTSVKQRQLKIILRENPMHDDYHTGIRTVEDIKTLEDVIDDLVDGKEDTVAPDFDFDRLVSALKTRHILLFSSKPIKNGVFVTPSKMIAADYAGGGEIYRKQAHIEDVAWIDATEGVYCNFEEE